MVEYLLSIGAEINARMTHDFAFRRCIKAPILSDNDIEEIQIYMDQTPLDIAGDMGFIEILGLFEEKIPGKMDEQITEPGPPSPGFG
jgi:ankyrin repeat protein